MTTITQTIKDKYIDIHSHIVFNVDDGAFDLKESKLLLQQAKEIGVEEILCTPHQKRIEFENKDKKICTNFKEVKREAEKLGITLYLANEAVLLADVITYISLGISKTINDSKYILLELPRNIKMDKETIILLFEDIIKEGYKPILAHPEVYPPYLRDLKFIKELFDLGVIMQLDAENLIKRFKASDRYKYALSIIESGMASIIASDAHNTQRNYLNLQKSRQQLSKRFNKDFLRKLYYENPKSILRGDEI